MIDEPQQIAHLYCPCMSIQTCLLIYEQFYLELYDITAKSRLPINKPHRELNVELHVHIS